MPEGPEDVRKVIGSLSGAGPRHDRRAGPLRGGRGRGLGRPGYSFFAGECGHRARVSAFTLVDGGLGAGRGGRGLWLRDDKDFKYAARRGRCCLAGTLKFIPRSRYVE